MNKVKIFSNWRDSDTLEHLINDFISKGNRILKSVEFTHIMGRGHDLYSAVVVYEQLEGNAPESRNENIINMHKEFLKYEINEIQEQLEGQYIKSIDIDFLNGAKAGLEKSLKHLEQIGGTS